MSDGGTYEQWERIVGRFECVSSPGIGRWRARCPAHDDRVPSLSLWVGDRGQLMIGCWAGCCKIDILNEVGLRMSDLWPPKIDDDARPYPAATDAAKRKVVDAYEYVDEQGGHLWTKLRYEPKSFAQCRPDPADRTKVLWSIEGVRRVLWNLPDLVTRVRHPVLITEGEKDAKVLLALGFLATTNTEGAGSAMTEGKWLDTYSEQLRGRRCVILPDLDLPGWRRAYFVAGSLIQHDAASVRIVVVPGKPPDAKSWDVSDYLAAGGTRGGLIDLIRRTPEWAALRVEEKRRAA